MYFGGCRQSNRQGGGVEEQVQSTRATDGLGVAAGFGNEIYTIVHLTKF